MRTIDVALSADLNDRVLQSVPPRNYKNLKKSTHQLMEKVLGRKLRSQDIHPVCNRDNNNNNN